MGGEIVTPDPGIKKRSKRMLTCFFLWIALVNFRFSISFHKLFEIFKNIITSLIVSDFYIVLPKGTLLIGLERPKIWIIGFWDI